MKILLALSPTRDNENAVNRAIEDAEGDTIHVVYVLDNRYPEAVSTWLLYLGFMGEAVTEDVSNVILDELRIRAHERIDEIKKKFSSKQILGTFTLLEGQFFNTIKKEYDKIQPDKVIIPVEKPDIFGKIEKTPELKFKHEFVGD